MDLLISLFLATLIIYFRNNKKMGQKQLAHVVGLTIVIYVGMRLVRKVCNLHENFDTKEVKPDAKPVIKHEVKNKGYHCGKCQTSHDQKNDLYIPHRALVSKATTEEERNQSRDKRLKTRQHLEEENKANNLKINPKALTAMREHNSKGASRQLTTGLEKEDGETNVNINVSYNISENILAEVQSLKESVSAFMGKEPIQDHVQSHEHNDTVTPKENDYLQGAVNTKMFKHMEATHNAGQANNAGQAHKLSAAETRKLVKGVKSPDAEDKQSYLPGYSYVHPKLWMSTNKPPKKFKVPISNERDRNHSGKIAPKSNGQFFEL